MLSSEESTDMWKKVFLCIQGKVFKFRILFFVGNSLAILRSPLIKSFSAMLYCVLFLMYRKRNELGLDELNLHIMLLLIKVTGP